MAKSVASYSRKHPPPPPPVGGFGTLSPSGRGQGEGRYLNIYSTTISPWLAEQTMIQPLGHMRREMITF